MAANNISLKIVEGFLSKVESSKNKKVFDVDLEERVEECDIVDDFKALDDVVNVQEVKKVVHQELGNRIVREHRAIGESFYNYVMFHRNPLDLQWITIKDMFEIFVYEEEGLLEHKGWLWGTSSDFHLMKRTLCATPEYLPSIVVPVLPDGVQV